MPEAQRAPAPDRIHNTDPISRFLYDASKVKHGTLIKARDLLPPPGSQETSVCRTHVMDEAAVWQHGDLHAKRTDGRVPVGRADFQAQAVALATESEFSLRLAIAEPPPRHANILGWPDVSRAEVRNQLAINLRDKARPIIRARTSPPDSN